MLPSPLPSPLLRLARAAGYVAEALHGAWLLAGSRRDRRPDRLLDDMMEAPPPPRCLPAPREGAPGEHRSGS